MKKLLLLGLLALSGLAAGGGIPATDSRLIVRDTNTPWTPPEFASRADWETRASSLRREVLFRAGLWPMPPRTPLHARIFGRKEHRGFSMEKVYFESFPGFFVTGNLYRPLGKTGPFPGVLAPHGHGAYGRLMNDDLFNEPGRAANMAVQGYVVFTYDMVGYNDSNQVPHSFASPRAQLWSFSVLGLQLWDSIRSLDFLESLPDVDRSRLAATGPSGGGTQTFLLTAVDDRVKVSAPVNMISAYMQGGSNCENAAGLRLDHSNIEIAALAAPRPLLMVSATGDWTRDTPRIEFPAVRNIFRLLDAESRVSTVQFHAPHNYNRDSREAVYAFFARWLLGREDKPRETGVTIDSPADLLVWHGQTQPPGANAESLLASWTKLEVDPSALRIAVAAEWPEKVLSEVEGSKVLLSRGPDRVEGRLALPKGKPRGAVLLFGDEDAALTQEIVKAGRAVFTVQPFRETRDTQVPLFTTYNRTAEQIRVQDILTAGSYLKSQYGEVDLVGGLSTLLARAISSNFRKTVTDAARFPSDDDNAYVDRLFIPGIRRAGAFRSLPADGVMIHNTGGLFHASGKLVDTPLGAQAIAEWLK